MNATEHSQETAPTAVTLSRWLTHGLLFAMISHLGRKAAFGQEVWLSVSLVLVLLVMMHVVERHRRLVVNFALGIIAMGMVIAGIGYLMFLMLAVMRLSVMTGIVSVFLLGGLGGIGFLLWQFAFSRDSRAYFGLRQRF